MEPLSYKQAGAKVMGPQYSHFVALGVKPLPNGWELGGGREPLTSQSHSPGILSLQLGIGRDEKCWQLAYPH